MHGLHENGGVRSRQVRALVAEDESTLRDELCETLASLWPALSICGTAANGIEALDAFEQHRPEVLFLDIEMPGMSGLEVAARASRRAHVAFVTAYDRYAVAAFAQGAVDYVMKPFERARLADTVWRMKARVGETPADIDAIVHALARSFAAGGEYLRWVTASQGPELRLVTVEEIRYFQADNKYTRVVTAGRESLIATPIRELVDRLDPASFWQIHRSTIVNVRHIDGIRRDYRGRLRVVIRGGESLPVSAPYAHRFRQM